jgi:hypothetical protein
MEALVRRGASPRLSQNGTKLKFTRIKSEARNSTYFRTKKKKKQKKKTKSEKLFADILYSFTSPEDLSVDIQFFAK